jgi:hypothetical protein
MEPFDDGDLKPLLRKWRAPEPPDHLRTSTFAARPASRWAWLLTGSVRIPVPAIAALVVLLVWLAAGRWSPALREDISSEQPVSLADFHPPAEMRVRIVGELP